MLPGEDGLAVCRRLRAAGESVPIVMLTREGRGRRPHRRPRDRAPTTICRSPSIRASSSPGSTRCCGGRRSGSRRARRRPKARSPSGRFDARSRRAHARQRRHDDPPHDRRVLAGQGVRAARAAAAGPREADAARARPRPRRVRPGDRRPGVATAQADRARSRQSPLHPDGLGIRLRLRAGRRGGGRRRRRMRRRDPRCHARCSGVLRCCCSRSSPSRWSRRSCLFRQDR